MIPDTIEGWMAGGPWRYVQGSFWQHAKEGNLEPHVIYVGGYCEPDRTTHEMAHLIACKDEDAMKADYGISEFAFHDRDGVSLETANHEIMVFVIENAIRDAVIGMNPIREGEILEGFSRVITDKDKHLIAHTVGMYQHVKREMKKHKEWSNPQKCWNEVQRKYALIKSMTEG